MKKQDQASMGKNRKRRENGGQQHAVRLDVIYETTL